MPYSDTLLKGNPVFRKKTDAPVSGIQKAIDRLLDDMKAHDPDSAEYAKMTEQLAKLHKLLPEKEDKLKKDTLLIVGGNLAGILLILHYEKLNVVASKALSFVIKTKV